MALSKHIDAEALIEAARKHPHHKILERHHREIHEGVYASRFDADAEVPKYKMPQVGVSSKAAYQLIHDEMNLDGSPLLNFASFVHTWMPEEATKLMMENINKNFADQDEYPATQVIHTRCISMLGDLWHAPKGQAIGTATTGSSEAIMLGGMALKKRWQNKRKAEGKSAEKPNIVFGANAQVALEKFARYWEVEARLVPVTEKSNYCMDPHDAIKFVDENTIGVMVILGSTYTGHFEPVSVMAELLDEYQKETGVDVPIHVDAASGGFVAPFAYPNYKWSFDIHRVASINTSGHKYGLVYAGLGWIVFRNADMLPKELIFELHYLGSTEYTYTLNFSRPAAPILGQYFNFLNLGFEGYRRIVIADLKNARILSNALELSGYYKVLSNIHIPAPKTASGVIGVAHKAVGAVPDLEDPESYVKGLPVVSFRFTDEFKEQYPYIQQSWIQTLLRNKGWIVPNYNLPPSLEDVEILRIVVRESVSGDLIERVVADLMEITEALMKNPDVPMLMATFTGQPSLRDEAHHGRLKKEDVGSGNTHTYARQC
ncbi:glutamate decarboxylase [Dacryopinax primogenitus]|uniref:Glutamate decarboxylase n=1 Tax=Dacryopinax primogenitus (strain DJM 731) TaxID=1858805 RepID=M5G689_DACPD|nr:glutamate decarboxylase [Dacryopinax primogenitus]EJT99282.1 glutamate decarboxylase [Dacryopinax primogenitus]